MPPPDQPGSFARGCSPATFQRLHHIFRREITVAPNRFNAYSAGRKERCREYDQRLDSWQRGKAAKDEQEELKLQKKLLDMGRGQSAPNNQRTETGIAPSQPVTSPYFPAPAIVRETHTDDQNTGRLPRSGQVHKPSRVPRKSSSARQRLQSTLSGTRVDEDQSFIASDQARGRDAMPPPPQSASSNRDEQARQRNQEGFALSHGHQDPEAPLPATTTQYALQPVAKLSPHGHRPQSPDHEPARRWFPVKKIKDKRGTGEHVMYLIRWERCWIADKKIRKRSSGWQVTYEEEKEERVYDVYSDENDEDKTREVDGQLERLVKWKDTWVYPDDLADCHEALAAYERRKCDRLRRKRTSANDTSASGAEVPSVASSNPATASVVAHDRRGQIVTVRVGSHHPQPAEDYEAARAHVKKCYPSLKHLDGIDLFPALRNFLVEEGIVKIETRKSAFHFLDKPQRRALEFSAEYIRLSTPMKLEGGRSVLNAVLAYCTGEEAEQPCSSCVNGTIQTRFARCVLERYQGYFGRACCNCAGKNSATSCCYHASHNTGGHSDGVVAAPLVITGPALVPNHIDHGDVVQTTERTAVTEVGLAHPAASSGRTNGLFHTGKELDIELSEMESEGIDSSSDEESYRYSPDNESEGIDSSSDEESYRYSPDNESEYGPPKKTNVESSEVDESDRSSSNEDMGGSSFPAPLFSSALTQPSSPPARQRSESITSIMVGIDDVARHVFEPQPISRKAAGKRPMRDSTSIMDVEAAVVEDAASTDVPAQSTGSDNPMHNVNEYVIYTDHLPRKKRRRPSTASERPPPGAKWSKNFRHKVCSQAQRAPCTNLKYNYTPEVSSILVQKGDTFKPGTASDEQVRYIISHCPCHWAMFFHNAWKEKKGSSGDTELPKERFLSAFWSKRLTTAAQAFCPEVVDLT